MFIPSKMIAHVKKLCHLLRNLGGFGVATYCTILPTTDTISTPQTILAKCEYVTIRLLF